MKNFQFLAFSFFIVVSSLAQSLIHHNLKVSITPALKQITVDDTITLSNSVRSTSFALNKNLKVTSPQKIQCNPIQGSSTVQECVVQFSSPIKEISLQYSGVIFDPVVNDNTSGIISVDGVSLSSSAYWYPQISGEEFLTFDITTSLPDGWVARSQEGVLPQDDIYIVANQFTVYTLEQNGKLYEVLLRTKDDALAASFLNLAPKYLEGYSAKIAPYPYNRFSIIENFYETGFGMPAFTLLGPSVIRLPFILYSSFPHEILHNWWGNSVYVDYATGNWCEGLTVYGADHELQKQQGKDHMYRMTEIVNYMDYASSGSDFPLRKFIGRHDQSSQAVGYGKSMMFFHMLEVQFGSATFNKAIQRFYQDNKFRKASFDDIQIAFEKETGKNLQTIFRQWVDQVGAPKIEITDLKEGVLTLQQTSSNPSVRNYDLQIPVVTTYQDQTKSTQLLNLKSNQQSFAIEIPATKLPLKIEVDPNFDVFRLLDTSEKPSTFSIFYASKNFTYMHESTDQSLKAIFDNWTVSLAVRSQEQIIESSTLLPSSGTVLLNGTSPNVLRMLKDLLVESQDHLAVTSETVVIDGAQYNLSDKVVVLSLKSSTNPNLTVIWILGPPATLTSQLAQRLLHYGNFSALIFDASAAAPIPNIYKQIWLPSHSSMKRDL